MTDVIGSRVEIISTPLATHGGAAVIEHTSHLHCNVYTKNFNTLHIVGKFMEVDYDVRFNGTDHGVVVADVLVACSKYQNVWAAQKAINSLENSTESSKRELFSSCKTLRKDYTIQSANLKVYMI